MGTTEPFAVTEIIPGPHHAVFVFYVGIVPWGTPLSKRAIFLVQLFPVRFTVRKKKMQLFPVELSVNADVTLKCVN
jgi:hypothetical protein